MSDSPAESLYVLQGPDTFLRRRHLERLIAQFADAAGIPPIRFDSTATPAEVLDELRTAPLLGSGRLVIVEDADAFLSTNADVLGRYLQAPCPTGTLILILDAAPRAKAARSVVDAGEVISCQSPDAEKLPAWATQAARRRGKSLSADAAEQLVWSVDAKLDRLDAELEKLCLYVGDREQITTEDVTAAVVSSVGARPFALANAVGRQRPAEALLELARSMTRRGDEFMVMGQLGWHLRSSLTGRNRSPSPRQRLAGDFRRLLAADLALKSGAPTLTTMQRLVVEMSSPG